MWGAADPVRHLLSKTGSERATSGAGNKIIVRDGKTHVVWQSIENGKYVAQVRSLDHKTGKLTEPFTLGVGRDNHARPNIIADHEGYLHVVIAGHHSGLQYRRSEKPNDATAWTKTERLGTSTYPVLECAPDGTMYMFARHDADWGGAVFYVKEPDGKWESRGLIVKKDKKKWSGYAGYQCAMVADAKGTLHAVFDFYEGKGVMSDRGQHVAVCYMASDDRGKTWRKADGSEVKLPARPDTMDALSQDIGKRHEPMPPPLLLSQGNIVVDSDNQPHIVYISHLTKPGQVIHATLDARGKWRQQEVKAFRRPFTRVRPVQCRGALTIDDNDALHVLLRLVPVDRRWKTGKPSRGMKFTDKEQALVWLTSRDGGRRFTIEPAVKLGLNFNQPNTVRAVGGNKISATRKPPFVYFQGNPNKNKGGPPVQNEVFLVVP